MTAAVTAPPDVDLAAFGLRRGEPIRFRRAPRGRWHTGHLDRIERDGSIGIYDDKGAARALRADVVEIQGTTPRGARCWELLADRMHRGDQLELF